MVTREKLSFAANLKRLRQAAKLSQAELARRTDLSMSLVSQLEQGQRTNPCLDTMRELAKALGVSVRELVPEE